MKLAMQILAVLRRPPYVLPSLAIAAAISLLFLYLDEFYFVTPYFVVYIDPSRVPVFLLDVTISVLSGIVLIVSVYEIRTFPNLRGSYRKTGMAGIVAAFVAGACPCYYLVPLLAALGGVGGVLGTVGILFYNYQIPIKLGSLGLLAFAAFTLERGLRAACAVPPIVGSMAVR
jgi:riboflavin transporter FmnP